MSPISNRQGFEHTNRVALVRAPQAGSTAIQQIGNLRYEALAARGVRLIWLNEKNI